MEPSRINTVRLTDPEIIARLSVDDCRSLIRSVLTECVCHELDENIKWGNERPFDPHAEIHWYMRKAG